MRKILFAAAGVMALAAAGAAQAQNQGAAPHGQHGPFQFDANSDGVITRQEFDAGHGARFGDMDANRDGAVTQEERRGHRHEARGGHRGMRGHGEHGEHLARADANNDGRITREEFLVRPTEMFNRMDANHDGAISADERPHRGERGARMHERHNPDANNDGRITRAEFDAAGARMFEQLDANRDGRVTREEGAAHHGGPRPH